jgi:hypothetical protein
MQVEKIYHYTSIDSLALILNSKNIRFARLDTVDDITEAQTHAGINFGKYFFVSCWTQEENKNIAQWKMYGDDMSGIRIELPAYPFRKIKMESIPGLTTDLNDESFSPLATNELFGGNYFILPTMSSDNNFFCGNVNYVTDVSAHWTKAVSHTPDPSGRTIQSLTINSMSDLPRLKNEIWKFQSEYRFLLNVLPMHPPFVPDGRNSLTEEQMLSIATAMQSNADSGVFHIDIPMASSALEHMVIRTGPLCTLADLICVEALVEKFAPKAVIESSHLKGVIRGRGR